MDQIQQGIILLLKSAITAEPEVLPEGFDIEAAYPLIREHHMATLCYDGALRCGVSRQHPVMQKLFAAYCKTLLVSEGQVQELCRVFAAFDANGIEYMPLKGCNMKALYPKPELRIMGDADVLIRVEQYGKIVPIMESLGFTAGVESDHEFVWHSPRLFLELHKRLIPSYNKDFYSCFGDGWQLAKLQQGSRYAMTPEDTWIYLFTHFAKHYRDSGIGCRHVVDLWVYRRANPGMDEDVVRTALQKLQLLDFHANICRLLDVWFEGDQADAKMEVLTACIFSSGSWGKREDSVLSQAIKESKHALPGSSSRLHYLIRQVFPRLDALLGQYPVLKKAPWLLPGVWVFRLLKKLIRWEWKIQSHRRNLSTLSKKNLDSRQQMLQYVGLDYNF